MRFGCDVEKTTYSRHRLNLLNQAASSIKRIQKYPRVMNRRLDVVVNDIAGETDTKIIDVFVAGDTNRLSLSKHRHFNCRKSEGEIAKTLHYNGRKVYLFALQQEWNTCSTKIVNAGDSLILCTTARMEYLQIAVTINTGNR